MEPQARSIKWEAPEHFYQKKGGDWYLILGIIIIALVVAAIIFGNVLFALLLVVSGIGIAMAAARKPAIVTFEVTVRGIKIADLLYNFSDLKAYYIDEEDIKGPQLLIQTQKRFTPLMVVPLPADYIDDVEDLLRNKLEEKTLREPIFMKIMERLGF
jgi:hypothetical protein